MFTSTWLCRQIIKLSENCKSSQMNVSPRPLDREALQLPKFADTSHFRFSNSSYSSLLLQQKNNYKRTSGAYAQPTFILRFFSCLHKHICTQNSQKVPGKIPAFENFSVQL